MKQGQGQEKEEQGGVRTEEFVQVHKPTQELLHRKKCLLPDDPPVAVEIEGGSRSIGSS